MSFTLTTSGAIVAKAGAGASTTVTSSGTLLALYSDLAEGTINLLTGYDWVANYASVGTNWKPALSDAVSSYAGNMVVNFDMSGYISRTEAQTIISVNSDNAAMIVNELKSGEKKSKMGV